MQWPRLILQVKTELLTLSLDDAIGVINLFNTELTMCSEQNNVKCTKNRAN